jgi:hypothetical protein
MTDLKANRRKSLPADLLRQAAAHHDLLRSADLYGHGLSRKQVRTLVGTGAIHRVHRGVFKVGTPDLSEDGKRLAAVWAAGPGSVLSHHDAGRLHGLPVRGGPRSVCVTTRRSRADHPGLRLYRTRRLHPQDVTVIRGIPVTSLARTVVDLAGVLRPSVVPTIVHEAEVLGLDLAECHRARKRARGRRTRVLTAALGDPRPRTKRQIEEKLEAIAHRAGLRDPMRNSIFVVGGEPLELDRYYPELRLSLEADGYGVHRTRKKFNSDRRRDRLLKVEAGITVLRYTWDDVTRRAGECERELARFLSKRAA